MKIIYLLMSKIITRNGPPEYHIESCHKTYPQVPDNIDFGCGCCGKEYYVTAQNLLD